jgi:arginyl-tRNA synthetase
LEESNAANDDLQKLKTELDEWISIAAELEGKYSDLFSKLLREISSDADPDSLVNELLQQYEKGDEKAKQLIRNVSQLCLRGFEETLSRIGIEFDSWDWESDLIWSGRVTRVVDRLSRTPYVTKVNGTLELDAERIVEEFDLRPLLGVSGEYHIPSLTLTRSDGTTLYTTRDIAYSLWKFEKVERVVNVIGAEQTLAQVHLKIALCALGYKAFASNQRHFAYGLVELPGYKMSSRRGRFITFDDVIDEAVRRAEAEVSKRTPDLPENQRKQIANTIAISAVKYALLSVEPTRNVVFVWDKVLNFETNSAPFINYAYTRAVGILRKLSDLPAEIDYQLISDALGQRLVFEISRFPQIFCEAADNLRPDDVANYCNMLAERFHEYYEKVDVIHVEDKALRYARGALIRAIKIVLKNGMAVLGMDLSERM